VTEDNNLKERDWKREAISEEGVKNVLKALWLRIDQCNLDYARMRRRIEGLESGLRHVIAALDGKGLRREGGDFIQRSHDLYREEARK